MSIVGDLEGQKGVESEGRGNLNTKNGWQKVVNPSASPPALAFSSY